MMPVFPELVLASELVVTKNTGEDVGRVLCVDVALEGRVLVEVRAALAPVGLVLSLNGVFVESGICLVASKADGTGVIGHRMG